MDSKENNSEKRFWEGESSLEDERRLRSSQGLPASYLQSLQDPEEDDSIRRIQDGFRRKTQSEDRKVIPMFWKVVIAAAAAIALLFAAISFVQSQQKQNGNLDNQFVITADTYEDPRKAFEEARAALSVMASSMNKANKKAGNLRKFESTREKVSSINTSGDE